MKIIASLEDIKLDGTKTGVALGSFDGVHMGHQTLIVNLVELCKRNHLKSIVYTFKNHPRSLTATQGAPQRIISDQKKFNLLKELGVDYIVFIEFDDYQRKLNPEGFIKQILKEKLNMSYGVVGFDYRFAYRAQGDTTLLKQLEQKYNYQTMVIKAIKIQDEVISSTGIRKFIGEGNIGKANLFLGRNYSIIGTVVRGKGLGKKFGFPTANISIDDQLVLPDPGVYITKCIVDRCIYFSITNVGYNPTIGNNPMGVETHIFDFNGDIYGKEIEIIFLQKARAEKKYSNTKDLVEQVNEDILSAKKFFSF